MMTLLGIPPRNDSELPELIRNNDDADMCGIKEIIEKKKLPQATHSTNAGNSDHDASS
jgi:hypothetical protein